MNCQGYIGHEDGSKCTLCGYSREFHEASSQAVKAGGLVSSERSAEALPPEGAARGASAGELAVFASSRLCKTCSHQERSLTLPPGLKNCIQPLLPINLVTGERKFPCIIARGYDQLCGPLGHHWQYKGQK